MNPKKKEFFRNTLLIEQDGRCFYCGIILSTLKRTPVVEHKIPTSRGGSDEKENLVLSCNKCNLNKGFLTPGEYRRWLEWKAGMDIAIKEEKEKRDIAWKKCDVIQVKINDLKNKIKEYEREYWEVLGSYTSISACIKAWKKRCPKAERKIWLSKIRGGR